MCVRERERVGEESYRAYCCRMGLQLLITKHRRYWLGLVGDADLLVGQNEQAQHLLDTKQNEWWSVAARSKQTRLIACVVWCFSYQANEDEREARLQLGAVRIQREDERVTMQLGSSPEHELLKHHQSYRNSYSLDRARTLHARSK